MGKALVRSFKVTSSFSSVRLSTQPNGARDFSHRLGNTNDVALRSEENCLLPCEEQQVPEYSISRRLQSIAGADCRSGRRRTCFGYTSVLLKVCAKGVADNSKGKCTANAVRALIMGDCDRHLDGRTSSIWHLGGKTALGRCTDRVDRRCCHEDICVP